MKGEIYFDGVRHLSVKQAALFANVSRDYITRLARAGKVISRRVGKIWFVEENSLHGFITGQKQMNEERKAGLVADRKREYWASQFALAVGSKKHSAASLHVPREIPRVHTMRHALERHAPRRAVPGSLKAVPLYISHPTVDLAHRIAALVTCLVLVVGAYAYANPDIARVVFDVFRDVNKKSVATVVEGNISGQTAAVQSAGFFDGVLDFFSALFNPDRAKVYVAVESRPGPSQPQGIAEVPRSAPTPAQSPIVQRIMETVRTVSAGGITEAFLNSRLAVLTNRIDELARLLDARTDGIVRSFQDGTSASIGGSLEDLTILNSTWTGGTLTNATITGGTISGLSSPLPIASGGTGTSSAPTSGQLLVGNAAGSYDLIATSSLGITSTVPFGESWAIANSALAPTTTLGILVSASSTIGSGAQAGGLTISGGATTTRNLIVQGTGTSTFAGGLAIETSGFVYESSNNRIGIGTAAPTTGLDIDVATDISGNLTVSGGSSLTISATGPINQTGTGQVTFAGNVDATNGLDVTTANFTVGGSNFIVVPGSGNTTIAGTLGLTGAATFGSTLKVTGAVNASSTLQVDGASRFYSTLQTDGALTAAGSGTGLSVTNNATIGGTLSVTGAASAASMSLTSGTLSLATQKITGLASPTASSDAANKAYVDSVAQGLDTKASCRAATTANITTSGEQTIDGVSLVAGDRVLVKNQTDQTKNGIYVVASGTWSRSTDADTSAEVNSGMFTFVEEGTVNTDSGWVLTTADPIVLETSLLVFTQFSGAGQITAGTGMTKSGNTLDVVGTANRITANADSIDISSSYVGQSTITTVGALTSGSIGSGFGSINIGSNSLTAGSAIFSNIIGSAITGTGNLAITGNGSFSGTLSVTGTLAAATTTLSGDLAMGNKKITGLADPTSAQEAATKAYVDSIAQGLTIKASVRVATTSNLTLSGTQTIDGVAVVAGNRVLAVGQSTASQNGIYDVAAGAWSRSSDANENAEVISGVFAFVEEGTANANTGWVLTTANPITLDTTSLSFTQFSGSGEIIAGDGLTKTSTTINAVGTTNRISVTADAIDISASYVGQSSITTTGALVSGSIASGFGNINIGASTLDAGVSTFATTTSFGDVAVGRTATTTIKGNAATSTFSGGISLAAGNLNLATGGRFLINDALILHSTGLGSSVLSSSLTSVGGLDAGSITTGFGDINIGANTLDAGTTTIKNLIVQNTSTSTFVGPIAHASGDLFLGGFSTSDDIILNRYGGNVGIGTTTPAALLSLTGTTGIFASTTATSTFQGGSINLLAAAGNTGCFAINGTCLPSLLDITGNTFRDWSVQGNGYLAPTTTRGIIVNASSTIGAGGQITGLTIAGGATTTGNAYFAGKVGIGTPVLSQPFTISTDGTACSGNICGARITDTDSADFTSLQLTNDNAVSAYVQIGGTGVGAFANTASFAGTNGVTLLTNNSASSGGTDVIKLITGGFSNDPTMTIGAGNPGNVGIGTTSPYAKLSVVGPVVAEYFHATSTTATSTISGIFSVGSTTPAGNSLFSIGTSSPLFTVDKSSGNVGIGISNPGYPLNFPSAVGEKISLYGNSGVHYGLGIQSDLLQIFTSGSGGDVAFGYGSSGSFTETARFKGTEALDFPDNLGDKVVLYGNDGGNNYGIGVQAFLLQLHTDTSAGNIAFGYGHSDSFSEVARFTGSGNLGIGTTSPYAKLSVVGPVVAEYFHATSTTATSTFSGVLSVGSTTPASSSLFSVGTSSPLLTVNKTNGYVGIGTTVPAARLDVHDSSAASTTALFVSNMGNATSSTYARMGFRSLDINNSGTTTALIGTILQQNFNTGKADLAFSTLNSGTISEALRITSAGSVGIGTTSPTKTLSVAGNAFFGGATGTTTIEHNAHVMSALQIGTGSIYLNGSATSTFSHGIQSTVLNITSSTASSTFGNGIELSTGCFRMPDGTCVTSSSLSGSGAANRVTFWSGASTLTSSASFTFDGTTLVAPEIQAVAANPFLYVNDSDTSTADFRVTASDGTALIEVDTDNTSANSFLALRTDNTERARIATNGTFGIGTTTPRWALTVSSSTGPQLALTDGSRTNSPWTFRSAGGNLYFATSSVTTFATTTVPAFTIIGSSGNVGIGTTTPFRKLSITDPVSTAQQVVGFDSTNYSEILTSSVGDTFLYPTGDDTLVNDGNLWVCTGGTGATNGCPAGVPATAGSLVVESRINAATSTGVFPLTAFSTSESQLALSAGVGVAQWTQRNAGGNWYLSTTTVVGTATSTLPAITIIGSTGFVGIGTTSPSQMFSVKNQLFVGANAATGLGTATSTFQGDIKITGKLDVSTIDPPYTIDGTKYATFVPSMTGVKEETTAAIQLDTYNPATGKYEAVIAFDTLEKASDLWLFYQATDFGGDWQYLTVQLTPAFDGKVFYTKDIVRNALVVSGSDKGEVSMRLTANRYDHEKWPNLRPDQDGNTEGTHVLSSKKPKAIVQTGAAAAASEALERLSIAATTTKEFATSTIALALTTLQKLLAWLL